ncbi:MAG: cytochrome b/b6 domain-containing protein [Rhizobiales bacterium]|nr:cytochrome b/b6 domain-containing protein [Hyphomicrobiales bacterium]
MVANDKIVSERSGARSIMVWDPLVRLIHWTLAVAIILNGGIVDEESSLHEWIGYLAVGLIGVRLIWGLIGSEHARFSAFPLNPVAAIRHFVALSRGDKTVHLSHNPIGALMVYNIWLTVLLLGITGYMMGSFRFFGVDWVEEAHEMAFNWLVFSIILHIGGVIFDTWRTGVSIVRAMINGRKRIPEDSPIK